MSDDLPARRARFAEEYILDLNGTQAAIRAGYAPDSARQEAHRLLAHPEVSAHVERLKADRSERAGVMADRILAELWKRALFDLRELYDSDGKLKAVADWPDHATGCVLGLETLEEFAGSGEARQLAGYVRKIKTTDTMRALDILGRHVSPKDRPVRLALPPIETPADILKALAAITAKAAAGEITPSEGQALAAMLETQRRAIESEELRQRIVALEEQRNPDAAGAWNGLHKR